MQSPLFPELPLPPFFDPARTGQVWRVPYQQRAADAQAWAERYQIHPASGDRFRLGLVLIDVQNTFCLPDFELYVAGRSGSGAIDDNRRLAEFIYRNLGRLSEISATLDTHQPIQIFHSIYLVDAAGEHPGPLDFWSPLRISPAENGASTPPSPPAWGSPRPTGSSSSSITPTSSPLKGNMS